MFRFAALIAFGLVGCSTTPPAPAMTKAQLLQAYAARGMCIPETDGTYTAQTTSEKDEYTALKVVLAVAEQECKEQDLRHVVLSKKHEVIISPEDKQIQDAINDPATDKKKRRALIAQQAIDKSFINFNPKAGHVNAELKFKCVSP